MRRRRRRDRHGVDVVAGEQRVEVAGERRAELRCAGVPAAGVAVPPPEYWPKIREICSRYDVLLVADEPVASLDASVRGEILALLLRLRDDLGP